MALPHPFVDVCYTRALHMYDQWALNVMEKRTQHQITDDVHRGLVNLPGGSRCHVVFLLERHPHVLPELTESLKASVFTVIYDYPVTKFQIDFGPENEADEVMSEAAKLGVVRMLGKYKFPLVYEIDNDDTVRFLNIVDTGYELTWFVNQGLIGKWHALTNRHNKLSIRDDTLVRQFKQMTKSYRQRHRNLVHTAMSNHEKENQLPHLPREIHDMIADEGMPRPVFASMN